MLVDIEQLYVATVAGEERTHFVEGPRDPNAEVVGMEPMSDEQAGQQLIVGDPLDQLRRMQLGQLHQARQARAVELRDELQQLDCLIEDTRLESRLQVLEL